MKLGNDFILGILGGMGPMAGVEMQKRIIENTPASSDKDHIKMICFTNPKIKDRSKSIREKEDFSEEIIASLKLMEKTGVDIGIISCNTAHAEFKKIAVASTIPLLNMIKETTDHIKRNFPNTIRVGVLATDGTIAAGIYEKYLKKDGISQIIPNSANQKDIMDIIYGIKAGDLRKGKVKATKRIIEKLTKEGADVTILGCTELSILGIKGKNIIDPADVVSQKIISNYCTI